MTFSNNEIVWMTDIIKTLKAHKSNVRNLMNKMECFEDNILIHTNERMVSKKDYFDALLELEANYE